MSHSLKALYFPIVSSSFCRDEIVAMFVFSTYWPCKRGRWHLQVSEIGRRWVSCTLVDGGRAGSGVHRPCWRQSAAVSNSVIHLHHHCAEKRLKMRRWRLNCIDLDQTWGAERDWKHSGEGGNPNRCNRVLMKLVRSSGCRCRAAEKRVRYLTSCPCPVSPVSPSLPP